MSRLFLVIVVMIGISLVVQAQTDSQWQAYKTKFNKSYDSTIEEETRKKYWFENVIEIKQSNAANLGYTLGQNEYTDRSHEEMSQSRVTIPDLEAEPQASSVKFTQKVGAIASLDWRSYGAVNEPKAMGTCVGDWAYVAATVAESFIKIRYNTTSTIVNLSKQFLIECTMHTSCQLGTLTSGMSSAVGLKGLPSEATYPYLAANWQSGDFYSSVSNCSDFSKIIPFPPNTVLQSYYNLTNDQLKELLMYSPVAIAMYSNSTFDSYQSGVYSCQQNVTWLSLNRAVVLIGYDSSGNWIIQTSLGKTWGQSGYATISQSASCGIGMNVAIFKTDYSPTISLTNFTADLSKIVTTTEDTSQDFANTFLARRSVQNIPTPKPKSGPMVYVALCFLLTSIMILN